MKNVHYSTVLASLAGLLGDTLEELGAEEFAKLQVFLRTRLHDVWHREAWPELILTEKRFFRADWSAEVTYNQGDEVYYPATQKYYLCLADSQTAVAPADGNGVKSNFWAESATSYSGAAWVTNTAYAAGARVLYAVTGEYYECHTAHTSSGTLTPDAIGANARWGLLVPFVCYVAFDQTGQTEIGLPLAVYARDPRVNRNEKELEWQLIDLGLAVWSGTFVWVRFLEVPSSLHGEVWDAAATYAEDEQVYFQVGQIGNIYKCLAATAAGESPATTAVKWQVVPIPERFDTYLIKAAYADWLRMDGQAEKANVQENAGEMAIQIQIDKIMGVQGQVPRITWRR
jgi:hypothetical protein